MQNCITASLMTLRKSFLKTENAQAAQRYLGVLIFWKKIYNNPKI